MKNLFLLLFSISLFSQEVEYNAAKKYLNNNRLEEATQTIQKAIRKAGNNKSKYYLLYATILKSKNVPDSSFYFYNLAEEDYLNRNISDSLLLTIASKAEFYRYFNKITSADLYAKKLSQFKFNQIQNKDIVAYALNRKLAIFNQYHSINKDTLQLINQLGREIINLEDRITNKEIVAYTLNELAQIEDYTGDKNKARILYERALDYSVNNELLKPEIDGTFNYARYYAHNFHNDKKAIEILEKIKDKVLNGSNLYHKYFLFLNLKSYYVAVNDYKNAYLASENCYKYSQEMSASESNLKLETLEKKFDVAKKQKEIKEKEIEIKIQNIELENSSKKFWMVFIIFLLTITGTIALFYFLKREKKSNKDLRILSSENDFLMAEANHRINNNLQLIIILISKQIEKIEKNEGKELKKVLVKINSIATLHKHLYKTKNKQEINIEKYLKDIEFSFKDLFKENNIVSNFKASNFLLDIDRAMYIGLMLTELYINSIKYAFINQDYKEINFYISLENNKIIFNYNDNGKDIINKNFPKPVLVDQLCRQLEIEYSIKNIAGFELNFTKNI